MIETKLTVAGQIFPVALAQHQTELPPPTTLAPVAIDIETNAQPMWSPDFKVRTIQLGSPAWDHAWVIPNRIEYWGWLSNVLEAAPVIIAHHAMTEWQGLHRTGFLPDAGAYWPKTLDTMLLTAVISHPQGPTGDARLGLKANVRALVDEDYDLDGALKAEFKRGWQEEIGTYKTGPRAGEPKYRRHTWSWDSVPIDNEVFLRYAAGDVVVPHLLFAELDNRGYAKAGEHYQRAARLSAIMQRRMVRGLVVDERALVAEEESAELRRRPLVIQLRAGGIDTDDGLTAANREILVATLESSGIKIPVSDKTGEPAIGRDGIVLAADGYDNVPPLLKAWYELASIRKYGTAYLEPFRDGLETDGTVHPDVRVMQAATGRTSVANPPLQQLPRVGNVRGCLRAREGYVLVGADLSQIEPRIAGALSKDRALLDVIKSGRKMHIIVADRMFGKNYNDEQYNLAKVGGLTWLYGGGKKTIAVQTGVSMGVAATLVRTLEESFPQVVQYKASLMRQDRVTTPYGREIQCDPTRPYAKMNYKVQGTAYDLFTEGTLRVADTFGDDAIWLTVHDEVLVEVPMEDAECAAAELGNALSTTFEGLDCPAIGTVVGRNWSKT